MGLDMYAHARLNVEADDSNWLGVGDLPGEPSEITMDDGGGHFAYWRKHPDLHRWMERKANERGLATSEFADHDFNCVWLRLTHEDLDQLIQDVGKGLETSRGGFFFGASEPEDAEGDLAFAIAAQAAMKQGVTIFYSAWF